MLGFIHQDGANIRLSPTSSLTNQGSIHVEKSPQRSTYPFQYSDPACTIINSILSIRSPIDECLTRPLMNCNRDFIAQKWTATKQSVIRHLREDHNLFLDSQRFWCDLCKSDVGGKHVSYHRCFRNGVLKKLATAFIASHADPVVCPLRHKKDC